MVEVSFLEHNKVSVIPMQETPQIQAETPQIQKIIKKPNRFKDIPKSWLIAIICVSLVAMRFCGIDSWTTASLGIIIGFLTGKEVTTNK